MRKIIPLLFMVSVGVQAQDINEILDQAVLSDSNGANCSMFFSADLSTHAGYNVYAVIPPGALNADGSYDCTNGRFRSCKGQKTSYVYCYNTGECNASNWSTLIRFNPENYTNFTHEASGTKLIYSKEKVMVCN